MPAPPRARPRGNIRRLIVARRLRLDQDRVNDLTMGDRFFGRGEFEILDAVEPDRAERAGRKAFELLVDAQRVARGERDDEVIGRTDAGEGDVFQQHIVRRADRVGHPADNIVGGVVDDVGAVSTTENIGVVFVAAGEEIVADPPSRASSSAKP